MCEKLKMMDCIQIIVIFKLNFTSWKCTYTYHIMPSIRTFFFFWQKEKKCLPNVEHLL